MRIDGPVTPTRMPGLDAGAAGTAGQTGKGKAFAQALADSLSEVNQLQSVADAKVEQLATGEMDNVQDVVLSMAEADLSFRLVLEIRNKLVESYQEIMRLQV